MKIHGTAKGGAISKKDFGVAFASAGGNGGWSWESDLSSSSGWTSSDTGAIDVDTTNEDISWTVSRGTNDSISFDLQSVDGIDSVSDEEWVLRFKTSWSDISNSASNQQWFGLSSVDYSEAFDANQYFIGFLTAYYTANPTSSKSFRSIESVNAGLENSGDIGLVVARSVDTFYFYEIKRTSTTTFELSVSSTDEYTKDIVSATSVTISDTLQNLRYIKFVNEDAGTGSDGTASITATFQFINDTSTPP